MGKLLQFYQLYLGFSAVYFIVVFGAFMLIIFVLDYLPVSDDSANTSGSEPNYSKLSGEKCWDWNCYAVAGTTAFMGISNVAVILITAGRIAPKLFHPELFEGVKHAISSNLQTLSVVLALFLTVLFGMVTNGPPLHDDARAVLPQLYFCFVYNGIGISFYGLSCTIIPLIYLQILDDYQTIEYLKQEPFINGLGAVVTCIIVICINWGFALIVFAITIFGKPMGFACALSITIMFISIYNKIKRHAAWEAPANGCMVTTTAKAGLHTLSNRLSSSPQGLASISPNGAISLGSMAGQTSANPPILRDRYIPSDTIVDSSGF
jgi:hypothetical protein